MLAQAKRALEIAHQIQTEVNETLGSKTKQGELLMASEVARILRVDDTTVRRWVKQGTLEAVILPHSGLRHAYRIKRETLDRLLGQLA